jgi:GT2 family glycosyltransferase
VTGLSEVGVVIVTHNSRRDVEGALLSLPLDELAQVVVVDNGSNDGTADHVEQLHLPSVRVLRQANVGFGGGCNTGAAAVGARYVLFLNPDARITPGSLRALVDYLAQTPRCALVAPRMRSDGVPLHSAGDTAALASELRFVVPHRLSLLLPERRYPPSYDVTGPVGVVEGACMLVVADRLREVGGFDERYFLFFEEHDLARRLRSAGYEVHLRADASAEHAVGASRAARPLAGRTDYVISAVRYLRDHESRRAAAFYSVVAWTWWVCAPPLGKLERADARLLQSALVRAWRPAKGVA